MIGWLGVAAVCIFIYGACAGCEAAASPSAAPQSLIYQHAIAAGVAVWEESDLLEPLPAHHERWTAIAERACGVYAGVCWHALLDAGLPPLHNAPGFGDRLWIDLLGRTIRLESWSRWYCTGGRCEAIPNSDGSMDRGIIMLNDVYFADVVDGIAYNPVLAIRFAARSWARWLAGAGWHDGARNPRLWLVNARLR